MATKRRYQWIDSVVSTEVAVAGAAAPGTVVSTGVVLEQELENIGGGATLIRVVGDLWLRNNAGVTVTTQTLYILQAFVGGVSPTDWTNDTFQRKDMLGTWMTYMTAAEPVVHHKIDLRTKRKVGQGVAIDLATQNHSLGGNDISFVFHLRALLLLP